jgi:hypothetical protein
LLFRVSERSCFSLFGIASHPDFSLEPLFIVGSIQMSWATHEYGFPIIECATYHIPWLQPGLQEGYQVLP